MSDLEAMAEEIRQLTRERNFIASVLKDPEAVRVNILRGDIALTRMGALHIAGATDYDTLESRFSLLVQAAKEYIEHVDEVMVHDVPMCSEGHTCKPRQALMDAIGETD